MRTIKEFLGSWFAAEPTKAGRNEIAVDIWYDWFCSEEGLFARTRKFIGPLHQLIKAVPEAGEFSPSGKNCCPVSAPLYDCLRVFDGDNFVVGVSFDDVREDYRFEVWVIKDNAVQDVYTGSDHAEMVKAMIEATRAYIATKAVAA